MTQVFDFDDDLHDLMETKRPPSKTDFKLKAKWLLQDICRL
jgi:hypothetical protein